jgi:hypothetical protein
MEKQWQASSWHNSMHCLAVKHSLAKRCKTLQLSATALQMAHRSNAMR